MTALSKAPAKQQISVDTLNTYAHDSRETEWIVRKPQHIPSMAPLSMAGPAFFSCNVVKILAHDPATLRPYVRMLRCPVDFDLKFLII